MATPIFTVGKRFAQVGIVLKDEKFTARRYEELLGIGPCSIAPISKKIEASLNEELVSEAEMEALKNDADFSYLGDIQFELLKPIGTGPSCHQWFFEKYGKGIQHVSFSRQADYDQVIMDMKRVGISSECSATLGNRATNLMSR